MICFLGLQAKLNSVSNNIITVFVIMSHFFRFRDDLKMNVNQHTPMASPYGQPQPGYGQPAYAPLDGGYPTPYAPYNGPASAYQSGVPQHGKEQLLNICQKQLACDALLSIQSPTCCSKLPFHSFIWLYTLFYIILYFRLFSFHKLSL